MRTLHSGWMRLLGFSLLLVVGMTSPYFARIRSTSAPALSAIIAGLAWCVLPTSTTGPSLDPMPNE